MAGNGRVRRRCGGRHAGTTAGEGRHAARLGGLVAVVVILGVPVWLASTAPAAPTGAPVAGRPDTGDRPPPERTAPHQPRGANLAAAGPTAARLTWRVPRDATGVRAYRVAMSVQYPHGDAGWSPPTPWRTADVAADTRSVTLCTRTPGVRVRAYVQARVPGRWSARSLADPVLLDAPTQAPTTDPTLDPSAPTDGPTFAPSGSGYYPAPTGSVTPTFPVPTGSGYYPLRASSCLMYEYG